MRIISGKYRGKKLLAPKGLNTRPTTDRVKEALFGAIQFSVPNARVLDMFAGSGALGIEALSRGAQTCVFIESDTDCLRILDQNLQNIDADYRIIPRDYMLALVSIMDQTFDIVLLDPPYESGFYQKAVGFIKQNNMLAEDGMLIVEVKTGMDSGVKGLYPLKKQKKYGSITLQYYKKGE